MHPHTHTTPSQLRLSRGLKSYCPLQSPEVKTFAPSNNCVTKKKDFEMTSKFATNRMKLIYSLWQVDENIKVKRQDHCPDREALGLRKTNQEPCCWKRSNVYYFTGGWRECGKSLEQCDVTRGKLEWNSVGTFWKITEPGLLLVHSKRPTSLLIFLC